MGLTISWYLIREQLVGMKIMIVYSSLIFFQIKTLAFRHFRGKLKIFMDDSSFASGIFSDHGFQIMSLIDI